MPTTMRILVLVFTLFLTSCINYSDISSKNKLVLHCPGFSSNNWGTTVIAQSMQEELINKQEFAVPDTYQTLWFQSKSKAIGLCIIPNKKNRGSSYGCGSAYAVYEKKLGHWQLADQKATICS